MPVYKVDPLRDPRWVELLERHPKASVFHSPGWLEALHRTYGYHLDVVTTSPPKGELENGLVFCKINSWLTGRRMVSLPFSDHCEPLVDSPETMKLLVCSLERDLANEHWKYIELRPLICDGFDREAEMSLAMSETFLIHKLDLRPDLTRLFQSFHKSCVQRKIHRAHREGLTYEEGRSESILAKFYHLLLLTRRRHQLPPQPLIWFRNLIDCLDENMTIRVVSKDSRPIAGILTLAYKNSLVYKYGCSDVKFHRLGGMAFLLWNAIQEGRERGAYEFDLGRSESGNVGLITFKDHWGATSSKMAYYRYPAAASSGPAAMRGTGIVKNAWARLPDSLLRMAGKVLYRHLG